MKKVYKGIVEGDVIHLEKQIGLPVGTQILVTLKTLYKDEQEKIKDRQIKLLDRGFYLGKNCIQAGKTYMSDKLIERTYHRY